jgi:hypothetical protein
MHGAVARPVSHGDGSERHAGDRAFDLELHSAAETCDAADKNGTRPFTAVHAVPGPPQLQAFAYATDTAEKPRKRAPILAICCAYRVIEDALSLHPLDTAGAIEMPSCGRVAKGFPVNSRITLAQVGSTADRSCSLGYEGVIGFSAS